MAPIRRGKKPVRKKFNLRRFSPTTTSPSRQRSSSQGAHKNQTCTAKDEAAAEEKARGGRRCRLVAPKGLSKRSPLEI